jgi:NAD-dependent dihydropyrimidine dehydrogenase PreA subunit
MKRNIVKILRDKCTGCGLCIPNCHEGALQIIDNKAVLISDLMCDGLGACLGHCPEDAIIIEEREAEPYNERIVMEQMLNHGKNTVIAHLKHLKEHNETGFLNEGIEYLKEQEDNLIFDLQEVINKVENKNQNNMEHKHEGCGCPGGQEKIINADALNLSSNIDVNSLKSELRQWPVQMHLINPRASYFQNSDLLVAADCVAFSMGNFHQKHLKGKSLVIACPKLDDGLDTYIQKFISLIDDAKVNTVTVMRMEVPCCGGLVAMVKTASEKASRKVPIKEMVISLEGEIISENWI